MWQKEVINLGISGDTSLTALKRLEELKPLEPSFVLIEFGGNDFLKKVPHEQTQKAFEDIVDYVHSLGAVAVLIDTGGNGPMGVYTKMNKKISKEKKTLFVKGIMNGIFTNRTLKVDAIHPNEKGHKIIADRIDKTLSPYL